MNDVSSTTARKHAEETAVGRRTWRLSRTISGLVHTSHLNHAMEVLSEVGDHISESTPDRRSFGKWCREVTSWDSRMKESIKSFKRHWDDVRRRWLGVDLPFAQVNK